MTHHFPAQPARPDAAPDQQENQRIPRSPGCFDLDVVVDSEEVFDASLPLVGEQVGVSEQGPACGAERVASAAAVAVQT